MSDRETSAELTTEQKRARLRALLASRKGASGAAPVPVRRVPSLEQSEAFQEFGAKKQLMREVGLEQSYCRAPEQVTDTTLVFDGRELINYCGYNYLGATRHRSVVEAVREAVERDGASASASRLGSGERQVHRALEEELADFLGTEACLVFVSGYGTNESVIGHLMGPRDLVLQDSLIHESIQRGAALSGAMIRPFPHNRWQAVDQILEQERGRYEKVLVNVEGVYSMDGDVPDLPRFVEVKERHQAMLMVDEAHSLGVLGATGRGVAEHHGVPRRDVDLWMGTLSKSLGSCGGYIAARAEVVEFLRYTTPGFVYSVGLTPPDAAAARAALALLRAEPGRVEQVQSRAELFRRLARDQGLDIGESHSSPVIPVILGDSGATIRAHHELLRRGVFVLPIVAPVVPENAARLRFFVTCEHSEEQIHRTLDALGEVILN